MRLDFVAGWAPDRAPIDEHGFVSFGSRGERFFDGSLKPSNFTVVIICMVCNARIARGRAPRRKATYRDNAKVCKEKFHLYRSSDDAAGRQA